MQLDKENLIFFKARYRSLNEKLATWDKNQNLSTYLNTEDLIDQMSIFLRLRAVRWKDVMHEIKITGIFLESILKTFDFNMEFEFIEI